MKAAIEPELVETITEVFRKITYTVAEDNKEIIIGLINGVMKNSDISNEFVIRVSPDDYRFLVNNQGKIYCAVSKEVNMTAVWILSLTILSGILNFLVVHNKKSVE